MGTHLHLENSDGVVQHLDPHGEHLAGLLGSGGRCAGAAVYARGRRVRVMHAASEAVRARQLTSRSAVARRRIHPADTRATTVPSPSSLDETLKGNIDL